MVHICSLKRLLLDAVICILEASRPMPDGPFERRAAISPVAAIFLFKKQDLHHAQTNVRAALLC